MINTKQSRFVVSVKELENRVEEQSILTVVLAIAGVVTTSTASASNSCGPFNNEPCQTPASCHF